MRPNAAILIYGKTCHETKVDVVRDGVCLEFLVS